MRPPRFLLFVAFVFFVGVFPAARAAEPFFKKGDVIAIVGGEDMVALSEYGYLELLLTRALPDYHLRFRNLAWEGDTVFEQRRDLNFPTWEELLEKIGATVVLCQFGQMESLAGKEKLPEFIAAYEKLLARFSGGGKRRVVIVAPPNEGPLWNENTKIYFRAIEEMSGQLKVSFQAFSLLNAPVVARTREDGLHLNGAGQFLLAMVLSARLTNAESVPIYDAQNDRLKNASDAKLKSLIRAKNRLWFDYWRVQNWAFLAGDRTNQPSSRDHLDPKKRWFPEERERFLPLIEAKEKEIDALAAKLAQP